MKPGESAFHDKYVRDVEKYAKNQRAEVLRLQAVLDAAREVLADHAEREATYPGVSKLQLNRHRVMGLLDAAIRAYDGEVKP